MLKPEGDQKKSVLFLIQQYKIMAIFPEKTLCGCTNTGIQQGSRGHGVQITDNQMIYRS